MNIGAPFFAAGFFVAAISVVAKLSWTNAADADLAKAIAGSEYYFFFVLVLGCLMMAAGLWIMQTKWGE
jgi:hypothetical protein